MKIRVLKSGPLTGAAHMAIDETLLLHRSPALRFYTWSGPCLSIGYFQKTGEIDTPFLKSRNIAMVRRLTGGKAVLHGQDLTYSIILPEESLPEKITESYEILGRALYRGLQKTGLPVEMYKSPEKRKAPANCFETPGWYEISVRGKKIAGSAQLRRNGMVMQQGSILLEPDYSTLASCFGEQSTKKLKKALTGVNIECGHPVSPDLIAGYLEEGFREMLPGEYTSSPLTIEEQESSLGLEREKYVTDEWNYLR